MKNIDKKEIEKIIENYRKTDNEDYYLNEDDFYDEPIINSINAHVDYFDNLTIFESYDELIKEYELPLNLSKSFIKKFLKLSLYSVKDNKLVEFDFNDLEFDRDSKEDHTLQVYDYYNEILLLKIVDDEFIHYPIIDCITILDDNKLVRRFRISLNDYQEFFGITSKAENLNKELY